MCRLSIFLLTAMWLSPNLMSAGEYNQVLSIGDAAPVWDDLPGVDDQKHSFKDWKDHKVIVVVFTCNSCPYAVDIEDRLIEFQKKNAERGVGLVAINVNKVEEDLMPAMKETAEDKGFSFPYLFDESQQIAKDYGAKYTPEFFVINEQRKIVYMGSMDDSPNGREVKQRYVQLAVDAALKGTSPETAETVPIGCRVRYERARRSRSRR